MKTKKIEVCTAIHLGVDCEENDSVDIRCGGPRMLGYDFYISTDENLKEVESKIKEFLKKYNRPFIRINSSKQKDFNVEKLWSLSKIEKCIKEVEI